MVVRFSLVVRVSVDHSIAAHTAQPTCATMLSRFDLNRIYVGRSLACI